MPIVLVVEDDGDVRSNLEDILADAGYQVLTACDGQDALEVLDHSIPDIILSDIMMPRLSGLELLHKVRNNRKTELIPFVILTAKGRSEDFREGLSLGADDYLIKPFRNSEVLKTIELRLHKKQLIDNALNETTQNISLYIPHELRTPLVGISGLTNMLIQEYRSFTADEVIEILERIKHAGERLHRLIERLVTFAYVSSQKENKNFRLQDERVKVLSAFAIITKTVLEHPDIDDRKDDVSVNLVDCELNISEQHFKFIVEELLTNAIKFSNPSTPITIITNIVDSRYILSVADEGRGMSEDEIVNIRPFIQHQREHFEQSGNGLGLITVKLLVELYGGSFEITSKPHSGSTVTIGFSLT